MNTKTVRIQVIKVFDINVEAETDDDAIEKAYDLSSCEIEDKGKLVDCQTDFAETVDNIDAYLACPLSELSTTV